MAFLHRTWNFETTKFINQHLQIGIAALAATGLAYAGYRRVQNYRKNQKLLDAIAIKRRQREESIREIRRQLQSAKRFDEAKCSVIVEMGFEELRTQLQEGELSSAQVLRAFQWKAMQAQEKTNCVCEFLTEAIVWADELDSLYKGGKKEKPPLFGIPVSIKENNFVKGHDSTGGCTIYTLNPVGEDGDMVATLKRLGAIPFVLTNVPQTMFSIGCSNPIYGTTTNPYDHTRTCGGSSGGEGAILGMRGSPLGIGGDIGGSVRVPAHCCGIYSLKPTVGRLAGNGCRVPCSGLTAVPATTGPMGVDVDSLIWFMRAVCSEQSPMYTMDPYLPPIPFDETVLQGEEGQTQRPLTIGYYDNDGWLTAVPACRRAVQVARRALETKGHRLIPIALPFDAREMREVIIAYTAGILPDGGRELGAHFASDIIDKAHYKMATFCTTPIWMRKVRSWFCGSSRARAMYSACESDTYKLRAKYAKIQEYKAAFVEFWHKNKLDCVLCPVMASPALHKDLPPQGFVQLWSYCALYNILNFVAGVLPCTRVTIADEKEALAARPSAQCDGDEADWLWRQVHASQKGTTGLPVGVQCVTLPFTEELCLRIMKELETVLNFR